MGAEESAVGKRTIILQWYVIGEFHGREDHSTAGLLGDIRGRPNAEDLAKVGRDAAAVARLL